MTTHGRARFTLDDLYNATADIDLPDGRTVTVRVLTEAEVQLREEAALLAAARREKELSDTGSGRYAKIVEPIQSADADVCKVIILAVHDSRYRLEAIEQYPFQFFPPPDEATEEERRAALIQQEEHEDRVRARREQYVADRLDELNEKLSAMDMEELRQEAIRCSIHAEITNARYREFLDQTVFLCTRDSSGGPMWSLDVIRAHGHSGGLNQRVYDLILETYAKLDRVDPWELQKKR